MKRANAYNTKQSQAILEFLSTLGDERVSAAMLAKHIRERGHAVGTATIYRHLNKLVETGQVVKYSLDGSSGAFYALPENSSDSERFLLKCENCGKLSDFECPDLNELYTHFANEHKISVNPQKTVFYGCCESCAEKNSELNQTKKGTPQNL